MIKIDITAFVVYRRLVFRGQPSMKVVMINDCASVGETLLRYLPPEIEKQHIERGRGLWTKTFGLAYKILRAKGGLYHVHYLLQDCYIASRLGKHPLVGHGHGSDILRSLHHRAWGRIVRHNLKHCDEVLVSTPDLLTIARQYRENVEYLPNPVDTDFFHPKSNDTPRQKPNVLIASSCDWEVKGTDVAMRALGKLREELDVSIISYGKDVDATLSLAKSLGLRLNVLPRIPHEDLREYYWGADLVLDQFRSGVMGMITLEAIACGRPVITFVSSEYSEYKDFPLVDLSTSDKVAEAVANVTPNLWRKEYDYLKRNHEAKAVAVTLGNIYKGLV
jgi:glycosyltransferase involved in cell wall biosynthesis